MKFKLIKIIVAIKINGPKVVEIGIVINGALLLLKISELEFIYLDK